MQYCIYKMPQLPTLTKMYLFIMFSTLMLTYDIGVQGTNVFESCMTDAECPTDSVCSHRNCDELVCLCGPGKAADSSSAQCLDAAYSTDSCGTDTAKCVGHFTFCISGKCGCLGAFNQDPTGKHCSILNHSYLGGSCTITTDCQNQFEQVCVGGSCTCKTGYRPATAEELRAHPSFAECRPEGFSLSDCITTTTTTTTTERTTTTGSTTIIGSTTTTGTTGTTGTPADSVPITPPSDATESPQLGAVAAVNTGSPGGWIGVGVGITVVIVLVIAVIVLCILKKKSFKEKLHPSDIPQ